MMSVRALTKQALPAANTWPGHTHHHLSLTEEVLKLHSLSTIMFTIAKPNLNERRDKDGSYWASHYLVDYRWAGGNVV